MRFLIGHCDFWMLGASNASLMSKLTRLTEPTSFNVMAFFAMKIVGRGWILSGISSKSENFLRTAPRLQAVDLHRLWAHVLASGGSSENLCGTRQSVLHYLPNWAVLCRQRSFCFHEPCQFWSAPTETLSRVFRFYLALSGMMPAYSCRPNHICWTHLLHQRLFTGQLMAVLNSATWWPTAALMSVLWQLSLVLKLYCYRICKHSTLKRLFHNW